MIEIFKNVFYVKPNLCKVLTLVYLIAEQDILREQDGNLLEKVKRAGPNKGAGWNILK